MNEKKLIYKPKALKKLKISSLYFFSLKYLPATATTTAKTATGQTTAAKTAATAAAAAW